MMYVNECVFLWVAYVYVCVMCVCDCVTAM